MWTAIPRPTVQTVVDLRDAKVIAEEIAKRPYRLEFDDRNYPPKTLKQYGRDYWLDGSFSTLINYAGQYQL